MTKAQAISAMILNELNNGADVKTAIDTVLGAGTHEKLAGEIYDQLRAQ